MNDHAKLDSDFWEKNRLAAVQREKEAKEKEALDRKAKHAFWLKEKDKMDESISRNASLSGCYTKSGMISSSLIMMFEDFVSTPSYKGWSYLYDTTILPNLTMMSAWRLADKYAPSIEVMLREKSYPNPVDLQRGITVLINERQIEIETSLLVYELGVTNKFTP